MLKSQVRMKWFLLPRFAIQIPDHAFLDVSLTLICLAKNAMEIT